MNFRKPALQINRIHVPTDNLRDKTMALQADLLAEEIIAPPSRYLSRMSEEDRAAIDTFLAAKGARHYPPNDSGDDFNLCVFLTGKGYRVRRNSGVSTRRAAFFIDEKPYSRVRFLAFVNRVRARIGLPPVGALA